MCGFEVTTRVVAWSVCVSDGHTGELCKMAEPIGVPFRVGTRRRPKEPCIRWGLIPHGNGQFVGEAMWPEATITVSNCYYHCKTSTITMCQDKDREKHVICTAFHYTSQENVKMPTGCPHR